MIILGAYETQSEAEAAMLTRSEPQQELAVIQDGDAAHPYRIVWYRG